MKTYRERTNDILARAETMKKRSRTNRLVAALAVCLAALCGLGLLPLFIVTLMTFSLSFSGMLSAAEIGSLFVSVAAGFFTNGEWLCAVVLVWALAARRRASREKGGGKKES